MSGFKCYMRLHSCEKIDGAMHCSVHNAAVLCENHHERVMQLSTIARLKNERRREKINCDFPVRYFHDVLHDQGSVKTLKYEWYIGINAYGVSANPYI